MDGTLLIQKPRSRGRFSRERHIWNQIHEDRFGRWIDGDTIGNIAQAHAVTQRAVHLSVAKVMAGLHRNDRVQALQLRHDNKFGIEWKMMDAALIEYRALMDPAWLFEQIRQMMRHANRARTLSSNRRKVAG